jgi:hypothetical protein
MANNIVRAQVAVRGIRPLLLHAFGPDSIPLEKGERTGVAGNDPEEWRKTVLMTKDRQLYLEPSYVFGCLRDASKYTKKGRSTIQTSMCATVQVEDARILIQRDAQPLCVPAEPIPTDPELSVYMDVRSVRNPATKGRNVRYRVAAAAGWQTTFTLMWDKTIVSRAEMEAVLNDAGQLVGLADGRSIGFGRFGVESFTLLDV